jgi:hypothetical protein
VPKNRTGRERRLTLGTLGIYTFVRHYTSKKSHSKNVSIGGQCWRYLGCGSKKKNYIPDEMVVQIDHHRAGREITARMLSRQVDD